MGLLKEEGAGSNLRQAWHHPRASSLGLCGLCAFRREQFLSGYMDDPSPSRCPGHRVPLKSSLKVCLGGGGSLSVEEIKALTRWAGLEWGWDAAVSLYSLTSSPGTGSAQRGGHGSCVCTHGCKDRRMLTTRLWFLLFMGLLPPSPSFWLSRIWRFGLPWEAGRISCLCARAESMDPGTLEGRQMCRGSRREKWADAEVGERMDGRVCWQVWGWEDGWFGGWRNGWTDG
jgi:hypothetical protein